MHTPYSCIYSLKAMSNFEIDAAQFHRGRSLQRARPVPAAGEVANKQLCQAKPCKVDPKPHSALNPKPSEVQARTLDLPSFSRGSGQVRILLKLLALGASLHHLAGFVVL